MQSNNSRFRRNDSRPLASVLAGAVGLLLISACFAGAASAEERKAYFAGGCFWCIEADFQKLSGVSEVVSGFTGGSLPNPTYSGNHKGHYEAIEVTYDSDAVSYDTLLKYFWRHIDPLDDGGQFCDRGFSYKTAVFTSNDEEQGAAEASLAAVDALFPDDSVATVVLPARRFWPVEEYHQDYADKNPLRYKYYRWNCGRDQRVEALWGDKDWGRSEEAH